MKEEGEAVREGQERVWEKVCAKLNLLCDMQHAAHKSHKKYESAHAVRRADDDLLASCQIVLILC